MTLKEKVEYYSFLHKQNLNGRETEDELFEAGILAGIKETEVDRDEFAVGFLEFTESTYSFGNIMGKWYLHADTSKTFTKKQLLEIYKKEKQL